MACELLNYEFPNYSISYRGRNYIMPEVAQAPSREFTLTEIQKRYDAFKARGLKLNLTRGKPAANQLDLSAELLSLPGAEGFTAEDGTDCRNYGGLQGLIEMRRLFSVIMGAP